MGRFEIDRFSFVHVVSFRENYFEAVRVDSYSVVRIIETKHIIHVS